MRNHVLGIANFHFVVKLDIGSSNDTRSLFAQGESGVFPTVHHNRQTLQIEEYVDHVFLHALYGAVLVQDTVYLHFRHRTTGHGRKQDTTERIAEGVAKTALERFKCDPRTRSSHLLDIDETRCKEIANGRLHMTPAV